MIRAVTYEAHKAPFDNFAVAAMGAALLHICLLWSLSYVPTSPLPPIITPSIRVDIIQQTPVIKPTPPELIPSEPLPPDSEVETPPVETPPIETAPIRPIAPTPQPSPTPAPTPAPRQNAPPQNTPPAVVPNIIAGPQIETDDNTDDVSVYVPSRWALEPALSKDRLTGIFGDGFENDISCIRSLSEDCTALRKEVFSEYQLTEQDLIWTESFAHSGLTNPALHGLSEYNIRKRLGVPIAGDNAFVILPGIAIDGNFWDTLHGVNKKCPVVRGIRRCPPLKPKADDKRFHIPKKETP